MSAVSKSFTAVGVGQGLSVKHGDSFAYSISGTFVGTVILEHSVGGVDAWIPMNPAISATAAASGNVVVSLPDQGAALFRFRCSAFTSGTIVTSITASRSQKSVVRHVSVPGQAKAGATSGWVVAPAADTALVTCPANSTASTLVVPLPEFKVGDKLMGFYLVGQIESGGNTATVDADLRVMTAAAADVTDASVASMTQLSITADTVMSRSNTLKEGFEHIVAVDESFYMLITATTGVATDIAMQALALRVEEAA